MDFVAFPKIARLSRDMVITEKLDGTNAQIAIDETGTVMKVGSRNRWLTGNDDNFGFYAWAMENRDELLKLGPGRHFGEWWGQGIQRGYGLQEKRFSLFNAGRWTTTPPPAIVHVVPVLWFGPFDTQEISTTLRVLGETGSRAAPGFMKPEGIVIYHVAKGYLFKKTFEKDAEGKEG